MATAGISVADAGWSSIDAARAARVSRSSAAPGVSWELAIRMLLVVAIGISLIAPVARLAGALAGQVSVIVREAPGAGNGPEAFVRSLGGKVQFELPLINGFSALLPAWAVP